MFYLVIGLAKFRERLDFRILDLGLGVEEIWRGENVSRCFPFFLRRYGSTTDSESLQVNFAFF